MITFNKLIQTLFLVFLFTLICDFSLIHAQNDQEPSQLLKKAGENVQKAESYKIKQTQNMTQEQQSRGRSMNITTSGTILYEKPFFYMETATEKSARGKQEIVGTIDPKTWEETLFIKSPMMTEGKWKNVSAVPFMNTQKLLKNMKMISEPSKRLKDISFDGSETVKGKEYRIITAKLKENVVKKAAENVLKGKMKSMIKDVSVNIISSDISYWIQKDSQIMNKMKRNVTQKIKMTMELGNKKQTTTMKQTTKNTLDYSGYGETAVPEKYKKKFQRLKRKNRDKEK